MNIVQKTSPNYTSGRQGAFIDRIVIHWIGAGTPESTIAHFASSSSQVSAHYLVADNTVYQFVNEQDTAWHAGDWYMNIRSIGIEHYAKPGMDLSEQSYQTSGELVRQLSDRYGIPLDREHIIGHMEVKATQCPGTIDIDRIIDIAKGDTMSECEKELEEMRSSRDKWKQKYYDCENTLETERDDHAKTIQEKNKQIEDLQKQVSTLSQNQISDRKEIESLRKELKMCRDNSKALEDQLNECQTARETEVNALKDFIVSQTDKINKLDDEVIELRSKIRAKLCRFSRWEVFWSLFRRRC